MGLIVEVIIRRGTDGPIISHMVGSALVRLEWRAPDPFAVLIEPDHPFALDRFTYEPTLIELQGLRDRTP